MSKVGTADAEQRRAEAARRLAQAAATRAEATATLESATQYVRDAVLAARRADVPVRRCAEIGGVAPDTVDRWTRDHRDSVLAGALREIQRSTDPKGRAWFLPNCFQPTVIRLTGAAGWSVPLFTGEHTHAASLLTAAYAAVLADSSEGLLPADEAVAAAVERVMAAAGAAATPGALLRDVLGAARLGAGPVHEVMAPLDRAARLLLAQPHPVWQDAVRPHLPPSRNAFAGHTVCQILDAALTSAIGGPTVGDVVRLADEELAVVTGASWDPEPADWPPTAYEIVPVVGGPRSGLTVPAEALTAIPSDDEEHGDQEQARPAYAVAVALAELRAELKAREDAERAARQAAEDAAPKAARDWHIRARVRITTETRTGAPDDRDMNGRLWKVGEEVTLIQWGRAGRPIERDSWWTSYDIDGAHILPAANIEVLQVLDETTPDVLSGPGSAPEGTDR